MNYTPPCVRKIQIQVGPDLVNDPNNIENEQRTGLCMYIHIYSSFNGAISSSGYTVTNISITEYLTGKNVEINGSNPNWSILPVCACNDWGKPRKKHFRMADLCAKIWTWDVPNTKHEFDALCSKGSFTWRRQCWRLGESVPDAQSNNITAPRRMEGPLV
jgi:hypothetical protein